MRAASGTHLIDESHVLEILSYRVIVCKIRTPLHFPPNNQLPNHGELSMAPLPQMDLEIMPPPFDVVLIYSMGTHWAWTPIGFGMGVNIYPTGRVSYGHDFTPMRSMCMSM